jgi:AraC-like DNA-binding protein
MAKVFHSKYDLLSSTLLEMRLHSLLSGATDAAGKWALQIPKHEGFKLYMVLKGEGWICFDQSKNKYYLKTGDCFMVTSGESFVASSDLAKKKRTTLDEALRNAKNGVLTLNGGGECVTVSVHFNFDGHIPGIIFKNLPEAIHVPAMTAEAASLKMDIERFRFEFLSKSAGNDLVLHHLAPIILIQILRFYMQGGSGAQNWLTSLSDIRLLKTFEKIHGNFNKRWSLEELAKVAGMSRAGFAAHFKKTVGLTPGDYLANWRMQIACGLLRSEDRNVSAVAEAVGYESLTSFSNAFKRVVGCRPGAYRTAQASNL